MQAKESFDNVCEKVALKYKDDFWKYSKSKHWLTKKDKKYCYKIFFYTSWNNISEKNVAFYGEVAIICLESKQKNFCINSQQYGIPQRELYWNIAKESDWNQAIDEFCDWVDSIFIPIVNGCLNNMNEYIKKVELEGFLPTRGYCIDIDFILKNGGYELGQKAAQKYYESLSETVKLNFKINYLSIIRGEEPINDYGRNMLRNYSNFKTIILNKIQIRF